MHSTDINALAKYEKATQNLDSMLARFTPRRQEVGDAEAAPMAFTLPLLPASVALALILLSAFFFPAVLETPGLESFMVGP